MPLKDAYSLIWMATNMDMGCFRWIVKNSILMFLTLGVIILNVTISYLWTLIYDSLINQNDSLIVIVMIQIILINISSLCDEYHRVYIFKLGDEIHTTGQQKCIELFAKASFQWIELNSTIKRTNAINNGFCEIGYLIYSTMNFISNAITVTISIIPIFIQLGWLSLLIVIGIAIIYWKIIRPMQNKILSEENDIYVLRSDMDNKISHEHYLFAYRVYHGDTKNLMTKLVKPMIEMDNKYHGMRLDHAWRYAFRDMSPKNIQFIVLIVAILRNEMAIALNITRSLQSITCLLSSITYLERSYHSVKTKSQALLTMINSIEYAEYVKPIDLENVKTLTIANIDFGLKMNDSFIHLRQKGEPLVLNFDKCYRIKIVGASGLGKTTLTKSILGYYREAKMEIKLSMLSSEEYQVSTMRHFIKSRSYHTTDHKEYDLNVTWCDFLTDGLEIDTDLVSSVFDWTYLTLRVANLHSIIGDKLSTGELNRLFLARSLYRAVISRTTHFILFLDEPDSNLNGKLAFNMLNKICANLKVTIFMTIHNTECINNLNFDYEITFHSLDKGSFSVHKII